MQRRCGNGWNEENTVSPNRISVWFGIGIVVGCAFTLVNVFALIACLLRKSKRAAVVGLGRVGTAVFAGWVLVDAFVVWIKIGKIRVRLFGVRFGGVCLIREIGLRLRSGLLGATPQGPTAGGGDQFGMPRSGPVGQQALCVLALVVGGKIVKIWARQKVNDA